VLVRPALPVKAGEGQVFKKTELRVDGEAGQVLRARNAHGAPGRGGERSVVRGEAVGFLVEEGVEDVEGVGGHPQEVGRAQEDTEVHESVPARRAYADPLPGWMRTAAWFFPILVGGRRDGGGGGRKGGKGGRGGGGRRLGFVEDVQEVKGTDFPPHRAGQLDAASREICHGGE